MTTGNLQAFAHRTQFGADGFEVGPFVRLFTPTLDHDGANAIETVLQLLHLRPGRRQKKKKEIFNATSKDYNVVTSWCFRLPINNESIRV